MPGTSQVFGSEIRGRAWLVEPKKIPHIKSYEHIQPAFRFFADVFWAWRAYRKLVLSKNLDKESLLSG